MNVVTKLQAIELYTLGRDMDLSFEQMKDAFTQYADKIASMDDEDRYEKYIQLELE